LDIQSVERHGLLNSKAKERILNRVYVTYGKNHMKLGAEKKKRGYKVSKNF